MRFCAEIIDVYKNLNSSYKAVFIILGIWSVVFSIWARTIGVFLYIFILTLLVMVILRKEPKYFGYFTLAFLVTCLCAVFIHYMQILLADGNMMFKDTEYYFENINDLVNNYRPAYLIGNNSIEFYRVLDLKIPQTGFIYLVGTLTKIFCGHPNLLFYLLVIASISSLVVLMVAKLAQAATGNEKAVKYSVIATLAYPHFLLYSGVLLKDILSILLIASIAYNIITIQKASARKIILTVIILIYFLFVRYRVGIILISICIFVFILPSNEPLSLRSIGRSVVKRWYVVLIFIVCSALLYTYCYSAKSEISAALVQDIPSQESVQGDTPSQESVQGEGEKNTPQGGVLKYAMQDTEDGNDGAVGFYKVIYKIPPGIRQLFVFMFILLSPFNFYSIFTTAQSRIVWSAFMDLGTLFWLACLPLFLVGMYVTIKKKYSNQILYFLVALVGTMALVIYVHIRWKLMVWPFIAVMIAIGILHRKQYKRLYVISIIGTIVTAGAYLGLTLFL